MRKAKRGEARAFIDAAIASKTRKCIMWPFATNGYGYSQIGINGAHMYGHRYVCTIVNGKPPRKKQVAHSCGNKLCINGKHMRWATQKENEADKYLHGRALIGERHHTSKLTNKQIFKIRKDKRAHEEIAKSFGVSRSNISYIKRGDTWSHL